jgi:hypothetical protein
VTSAFAPLAVRPYEPFLLDSAEAAAAALSWRRNGYAVLGPDALEPSVFEQLRAEATRERRLSAWPLRKDGSAGALREDNMRAQLGRAARELMAAGATRALLATITGRSVVPGWSASCFTYYDEPGRYMGFHCDKPDACSIAMLVTLEARWPADERPGPGMQLIIYDDGTPTVERARITSRSNRIVVLHGSVLAHERPPVRGGESVTMLCGCYAHAE